MFGLIENMFIGLLTGIVSATNHTKGMSLSYQKCMTQSILINIHPNGYSQEIHYRPFAVNLDVLEVVILLMTCLIKYVFQTKQEI